MIHLRQLKMAWMPLLMISQSIEYIVHYCHRFVSFEWNDHTAHHKDDVTNISIYLNHKRKMSQCFVFTSKVLATVVTVFLTMDVGASVSFPTILIAALTGRNNQTNPNETLHMTPIQASWLGACILSLLNKFESRACYSTSFTPLIHYAEYKQQCMKKSCWFPLNYYLDPLGSSSYLIKLFGSLICGFISDTYGRKNAMIFINFPALLAWYFFYYSTSIERVFIANGLLSVTSGFVKATTVTYVGEIR